MRVDGTVDGNVRCFCNTLTLDSSVGKNLTAFAARVELNPGSTFTAAGSASPRSILADGKVGRDLLLFSRGTPPSTAPSAATSGCGAEEFLIGPTAAIAGRFHVRSNSRPDIAGTAKLGQPLEFEFVAATAATASALRASTCCARS